MSTSTSTVDSPNPIFADLLEREPDDSYIRRLFGLGHRDDLPEPMDPDEIHDPAPVRPQLEPVTVEQVRAALGMGPIRFLLHTGHPRDRA